MSDVVTVQGLTKTYGHIEAVKNINFAVKAGEVFGLLGPNGAGKTTTMEIVEGLRAADSGEITVLGMNIVRQARQIKARIGVQLQTTALYPRLSVSEVLDLFGSFFPRALPVEELLRLARLEDSRDKRCINLSGGQQQRLSVALAMVNDPDILFLDEPTAGLDPQARHNIWDVIQFARERGKTVFVSTHYMEEAELLCDRVAIIDYGDIIATDAPETLIDQHFQEEAIEFELDHDLPVESISHVTGATGIMKENGKVTIYSNSVPATVSALLDLAKVNGLKMSDLRIHRATLEDVFLKLTGRRIRE